MAPTIAIALLSGCTDRTSPTDTSPPDTSTEEHTGYAADHSGTGTTHSTPVGTYGISDLRSERVQGQQSVLRLSWTQAEPATVHAEFTFEGETRESPTRDLPAGDHQELLLGIPYGTDVTVHLVLDGALGPDVSDDLATHTGPLPDGIPPLTVQVADATRWDASVPYLLVSIDEPGGYFLGGAWWTMVLDRQGRVVWGHRSEQGKVSMYPRVSAAGTSFLVDENSYWGSFDGGARSQVQELQIDGTELRRWDTPGLHHSYTQLPDGSLVYGSYVGGFGGYLEDVVRLWPDGHPETLFVCRDWLDSIGETGQDCGSNTVSYHAEQNSVLVSWFTFEALTEIDLDTHDVIRVIGHVTGGYGFDPADSAFWYQHGAYYTDSGTLLLSTHVAQDDTELVAREYRVDDARQVVQQVWTVGEGQGVTGDQMGEARRLPNGDTLHNFGTNAHLREYQPDGTVVWEVDWPRENTIGHSEPVADLYAFEGPQN